MYTLGKYTEHQRKNWAQSKRIVIYESESQLLDFIRNARKSKNSKKKMYFGTIPEELAARIKKDTGASVKGYNVSISEYEIRKIFKRHGEEATEAPQGQRAVTEADIASIPKIVQNPDKIVLDSRLYIGHPVIKFVKTINGRTTVISYVSAKHNDLAVQTIYSGKNKDGTLAALTDVQAPDLTSKTRSGTGSATNNIQNPKAGKTGGKAMSKGKKEKPGSLFGQVGKNHTAEATARLLTHFKRGENDWVSMEPNYPRGICVKKEKGYYYLDVIGANLSKLSFAMRAPTRLISDGHVFWQTMFECIGSLSSYNGPDRKGSVCLVNTREPIRDILKRNKKAILHKDEGIPLPKAPLEKSWPIPDISKTNIFKTSAEDTTKADESEPIPARLQIWYYDEQKKRAYFEPKDIINFSLEKIEGKHYLRAGKTLVELSPLTFGVGWTAENKNGPTLSVFLQQDPRNLELKIYLRKPASVDFFKKSNFKIDKSISLDL